MFKELLGEGIDISVEQKLFSQSHSSARSWQDIKEIVGFPREVKGMRILDIGGGGSEATAILLERGADAYAIDPRYEDKSQVRKSTIEYLLKLRKIVPNTSTWKKHIQSQHESLERFLRSIKKRSNHYKAAFASKIPFGDNYFDIVFSVNCITEYLDQEPETLIAAIAECVRVTKSGGQIHLFPFQDAYYPIATPNYDRYYEIRTKNQDNLLELLSESRTLSFEIRDLSTSRHKKLVISKSG